MHIIIFINTKTIYLLNTTNKFSHAVIKHSEFIKGHVNKNILHYRILPKIVILLLRIIFLNSLLSNAFNYVINSSFKMTYFKAHFFKMEHTLGIILRGFPTRSYTVSNPLFHFCSVQTRANNCHCSTDTNSSREICDTLLNCVFVAHRSWTCQLPSALPLIITIKSLTLKCKYNWERLDSVFLCECDLCGRYIGYKNMVHICNVCCMHIIRPGNIHPIIRKPL